MHIKAPGNTVLSLLVMAIQIPDQRWSEWHVSSESPRYISQDSERAPCRTSRDHGTTATTARWDQRHGIMASQPRSSVESSGEIWQTGIVGKTCLFFVEMLHTMRHSGVAPEIWLQALSARLRSCRLSQSSHIRPLSYWNPLKPVGHWTSTIFRNTKFYWMMLVCLKISRQAH